jgi:hypothetical protein
MAMNQVMADEMLAEFMVKGGRIVKYKRQAKSKKPLKSERNVYGHRIEFMPDNSRIGRNSGGNQTPCENQRVYWLLVMGLNECAAQAMIEACKVVYVPLPRLSMAGQFDGLDDLKMPMVSELRFESQTVNHVVHIDSGERIKLSKAIGCETRPAFMGNWPPPDRRYL